VGTRFGDDHDVQHVSLKRNEAVEVLETATLEGQPGTAETVWAKIAPPAGEFRWIRAENIAKTRTRPRSDNEAETEEVQQPQPEDGTADATGAPVVEVQALTSDDVKVQTSVRDQQAENCTSTDQWVAVARREPEVSLADYQTELPIADTGDTSAPTAAILPTSPPEADRDGAEPSRRSWRPGAHAFRDRTLPLDSTDVRTRELLDVDVRLSQTVSQDISRWELDDLQARVEAVIDTSGDPRQRERARQLLGSIVQFQDIKRRHQRLTGSRIGSLDLARSTGNSSTSAGLDTADGEVPYDGTGWLMPVVTQRGGIPRYALTDRNGRILQFVTPSPGVNLRRFEREQIGVIGRRGYVPQLRTPHLMAERIVVLNRHRR
jgi:hypothetical protein